MRMNDVLLEIQQLQFSDKRRAEEMVRDFVRDTFPLDVVAVELRPSVVSLNSFNGFLVLGDGSRLFFKTHTEADSAVDEFYNAEILIKAGYPMIQAVHSSMSARRQFLVYEVVTDPSVFEVAWQIESGVSGAALALTGAQQRGDRDLLDIYLATLEPPDVAAAAPVHQLFYHRLTGPRMGNFYPRGAAFDLPDGHAADLRGHTWTINGQRYTDSLDDLIARSAVVLDPAQAGPSVVGHGDAHNGNVFLRRDERRLTYFDPAFAGRHDPLLDLAKPLFHNVFAMWMYYPEVKRDELTLSYRMDGDTIVIEHDYALPAIRLMFLRSKIEQVLAPIAGELRRRGWLAPQWRARLKSALFCCPLLTKNLADRAVFPAEIGLLGLAFAVEMGAESSGERSLIDRCLDEVEEQVR
jgi:hypothetical protein